MNRGWARRARTPMNTADRGIKFVQTDSGCIYFLKACCLLLNCPFDRIRKARDPAEPRSWDHATTHLGLYYSFHMLRLVNKRPSMPAVDTATELLILHDPPSSANGLPTSERAQLPVSWRKQRLCVSLLVLLRREIVHVLRDTLSQARLTLS